MGNIGNAAKRPHSVVIGFTALIHLFMLSACADITSTNADILSASIGPQYNEPGAPVALEYQLPKRSDLGALVEVNLRFSSDTPAGKMHVSLNADDGIQFTSNTYSRFDLANESNPMLVQLYSQVDGLHYINILVQENDPQGQQLSARNFSVPVQIGSSSKQTRTNPDSI